MVPGLESRPERTNVLITCGGKWVGMVLSVKEAMMSLPVYAGGQVLVGDCSEVTPAGTFADGQVQVPRIREPGYVDALLKACVEHQVGVLLPIIDMDLEVLCEHAGRFAEVGTHLVSPSPELFELCFDKLLFQHFVEEHGLSAPAIVSHDALADANYPLFARRRRGFGSIGAQRVDSAEAAQEALKTSGGELVFHAFTEGQEVSVDAFISATGEHTVRVQRVRDKVVGGEAYMSSTIRSPLVTDLATRTLDALSSRGLRGPLNIQLFLQEQQASLIEVNTRLGSASTFSNFASGGRLFRSVLAEAKGEVVGGDPSDYRDDVSLSRFIGDVYHDATGALGSLPVPAGAK